MAVLRRSPPELIRRQGTAREGCKTEGARTHLWEPRSFIETLDECELDVADVGSTRSAGENRWRRETNMQSNSGPKSEGFTS